MDFLKFCFGLFQLLGSPVCSWQSPEALGQIWCHEAADCQAGSPVLHQVTHYSESNSSANQMEAITYHFWLIFVCQKEVSKTELALKLLSFHLSLNYSWSIPCVSIIPAQGWIWWRTSSRASGNRRWITQCAALPCYFFYSRTVYSMYFVGHSML